MKINTLFLRKLLVAFLVGFGGVFIPSILSALDGVAKGTPDSFSKALIISAVAGGVAAGLRAAFVLIPGLNLVPSDADPIVSKK